MTITTEQSVALYTRQQVIDQLAHESGVMPSSAVLCGGNVEREVRDALASMQARVEQLEKDADRKDAALGDSLFNGFAVVQELRKSNSIVIPGDVSDVLDAAAKLYNAAINKESRK